METYVRGFSYQPEKLDLGNLQADLERTWKNARRERLKQREEKIWEEFVKENDVVSSVCEDDQYQFLDDLAESFMKNIKDGDMEKVKEVMQFDEEVNKDQCQVNCDNMDDDRSDMFQIYDDEKDEGSVDGNPLNDSMNSMPETVREKHIEFADGVDIALERPSSETNTISKPSTGKSTENVTNIIESSIYCGKVKDLRSKIDNEILDMISLLDRRDIFTMEKDEIARILKRSAEFCTRFNRIYMYQLQRQMQDIKRNNSITLPFAKHTQFQSQMVRVVSLHQNLLQSFQVFRKSVDQTWCVRESVSALGALVGAARAATSHCSCISPPKDFVAAKDLYDDNLLVSCGKLEQFVNEYAVRCEEFLMGYANVAEKRKSKDKKQKKKQSLIVRRSPITTNSEAESRLSMYSLTTVHLNKKSHYSKDGKNNGISKTRGSGLTKGSNKVNQSDKNEPESSWKSPRSKSRRPLMRDPHEGRPRAPRHQRVIRDDISTMVESVEACASNHMIMDPTPPVTPHTRRELRLTKNKISPHKPKPVSPKSPKITATVKHLNLNATNGGIQSVCIEMNSAQRCASPTSKSRSARKDSGREEKRRGFEKVKSALSPRSVKPDTGKSDSARSDTAIPDSAKQDPLYHESMTVELKTSVLKGMLKGTKFDLNKSVPGKTETVNNSSRSLMAVSPLPTQNRARSPGSPKLAKPTSPTPKHKPVMEDKRVRKPCRSPDRLEVTRLLKQLCSGDSSGGRIEQLTGQKNVQLQYVNGSSPRTQPSTPQLLRILEETIQKKEPKSLKRKSRDVAKYRLSFNLADSVTDNMFQYRTKFLQHMLTSPMYANSAVGKPWETIGSVSEQIIDELLVSCMKKMEIKDIITELYRQETS